MRRLVLPCAVSLAFIGWAPFMGLVRDALEQSLSEAFVPIVAAAVGLACLAGVIEAARRIREQRIRRYGAILLALGLFGAYAWTFRTGPPEVDVVERVHFVQYGLVAVLFYRALLPAGDPSVFLMTLLCASLVGIGEEWLQWLVPTRVGDVRDVVLNFYAVGCGVVFGVGLQPPGDVAWRLGPAGRRRVLRLAAVSVLAFGGFFHSAHLGYEILDPEIGRFRSYFTRQQLERLAVVRAEEWRRDPPLVLSPIAIEDYYLTEGGAHARHRNTYYVDGRFREAWLENRILEGYYEPFLDVRSFISRERHRWPPAQLAEVERSATGATADRETYESPAHRERIAISPTKPQLWTIVLALAAILLALSSATLSDRGGRGMPRSA